MTALAIGLGILGIACSLIAFVCSPVAGAPRGTRPFMHLIVIRDAAAAGNSTRTLSACGTRLRPLIEFAQRA
jgi:hypothetical protein